MVSRRATWFMAAALFVASLAATVVLWPRAGIGFLVLPFVVPFVRSHRRPSRKCPRCGWSTRDASDVYCPRDGTSL